MNPLAVRQSFQNANLEALREAQGFNDLQARDAARRREVDERATLEQNNVPLIPKADALRTEERRGREQRKRQEAGEQSAEGEAGGPEEAISAEGHLDFLA
jgi:hypothetical protein